MVHDVQLVLSSVHAVKGLECVVCFVVGMDTKAWRYLSCPIFDADVQQVCHCNHVPWCPIGPRPPLAPPPSPFLPGSVGAHDKYHSKCSCLLAWVHSLLALA